MASVEIKITGTLEQPYTVVVRESTEDDTFPNRYVSGEIPGKIEFNPISDGQIHTYNVFVNGVNCAQTTSFDLSSDCVNLPSVSASTRCTSYNPTDNSVQITVTPQLSGASQIRLVVQAGNQIFFNQFAPVNTATQITVQANTPLSIRVEDVSYGGCSNTTTYVAECAVSCAYSISVKNPNCQSSTVASIDVTINDQNPGEYSYSLKVKGESQERILSIVFGNLRFTPKAGTQTYVVSVTRSNCPLRTAEFTLTCGSEGCTRLNATSYQLYSGGSQAYTSFTDVCAKYCNNIFSEFTAYLTGTSVGSTVYSLGSGCSVVSDGYYVVVDANKQVVVIIRIQSGKITETQPACNCSNPSIGADVTLQQPLCVEAGLSQAVIYVMNVQNAQKYSLCEGSTFTCSNDCSTATTFVGGYASISVQAPQQGTQKNYVLRIYNTLYGCNVYRDYPLTITSPTCCVTYQVNSNGNANTTLSYKDCSGVSKSENLNGSNTIKKVCAQQGTLTVSGVATFNQTTQGCDTSLPCSISFNRTGFFCEDNLPKIRYTGNGGVVEGDYQIKIGNQDWIDFNQNRIHTLTGIDNETFNVQIRLKSNNSCIINDTVTFATNCTNTGGGCNKPSISAQYLGTNNGVGFSNPVDACENACNDRVQYDNYYASSLSVGSTVYRYGNNTPNDCSTLGDGWFVGAANLYRIQNGIIVETAPHCFCGEVPTLNPSVVNGVQNDATYTVNVGYNCTTSGIRVYKNGADWKYLSAGTHAFTFNGNEVNNGDRLSAKTVCGDRQSGSSNEVIIGKDGGTVEPPPAVEVCNQQPVGGNGAYQITTKTYNVTFNGNIFYMLSTGGIPDKLSVQKNGVVVENHLATSWRTAGSIPVRVGDTVDFIIDGKTTGIQNTGWTFYSNCQTPYDVNGTYAEDAGSVKNQNNIHPTFSSIQAVCNGSQLQFVVNANPAASTGSRINRYKLLNNTPGASDSSFLQASGWQSSNVLTQTIGGINIQAGKSYSVYAMDESGSFTGISEVIHPGCTTTPTPTPTCDKSTALGYVAQRGQNNAPLINVADARNKVCSGTTLYDFTVFITGNGGVGSLVYTNQTAGDCTSIVDGYYILKDNNNRPWKVIGVAAGKVISIDDFPAC
jgi:hypothetical protein